MQSIKIVFKMYIILYDIYSTFQKRHEVFKYKDMKFWF